MPEYTPSGTTRTRDEWRESRGIVVAGVCVYEQNLKWNLRILGGVHPHTPL